MTRTFGIVVLGLAVVALGGAAGRGGEKTPEWKPFLPKPAFEVLIRRSLQRVGTLAADKAPLPQLHTEALVMAGYAMSASDAPAAAEPATAQALKLATLAGPKGRSEAQARKYATELAAGTAEVPKMVSRNWTAVIGDLGGVMNLLRGKAKGGEGLAADLQYTPKLKNQNGVEALINALAAKKLSDANVAKTSKELELLGYRVAAIGALTLAHGPSDAKKGSAKEWDEQAVTMRDAAVELAEAAHKKDAAAIHAASKRLENSCVECHSKFK